MENYKNLGLSELTDLEIKETEGGILIPLIIAGIGACCAAYSAGYITGKVIF